MAIFQNDIPQPSDIISVSQGDLLQNNAWVPAALGKDHQIATPNSNSATSFEGRHIQVSFNDRANDNLPFVGDGANSQLWGSNGALWFRNSTGAATKLAGTGSLIHTLQPRAAVRMLTNGGAPTITYQSNVGGVSYLGSTGRYSINFAVAMPSTNYYIVSIPISDGSSGGWVLEDLNTAKTTAKAYVVFFNSTGSRSNSDPVGAYLMFFGG